MVPAAERRVGGFTLVEILIVITILGVLAGIVVFAVGNMTDSANTAGCASEATSLLKAAQVYRAQQRVWVPGDVGTPLGPVTL